MTLRLIGVTALMITCDDKIQVLPFTRQEEGEEVIVGLPDTGAFFSIPLEGLKVLDLLAAGLTIEEAARASDADLTAFLDFLSTLESYGLVVSGSNTNVLPMPSVQQNRQKRYHFSSFPTHIAKRIFSRPIICLAIVLMIVASVALLAVPELRPHAGDLYFDRHRTLIWTLLVLVSYGSVMLHEASHVIAARSKGVNSRLGFGNRLWDLVIEADLTGLWSIPKKERYLPLLAGCILDATFAALLILLLTLQHYRIVTIGSLPLQVLRAIMFTYVTRVFWQFFLFVRTDYYYVIATCLGCRNLLGDTEDYLRNRLARVIPFIQPVDQSSIPRSEQRIIVAYSFIWVLGRVVAVLFLFAVTVPLAEHYFANIARTYKAGYSANHSDFLDSILMTFYFIVPIAIGLPIWLFSIGRRMHQIWRTHAA